jgi:prepilin-type processing-associated H-X9-DG protein
MKRVSFTLTELLVVILIIALLMAIITPLLRSSRQRAKSILCSSNIKQLSVGLFSYETQNQTFPAGFDNTRTDRPPGNYAGFSYDRSGWWWFNFIEGYYKRTDERNTVVKCPSKWLTDLNLNNDILCGNYGVNYFVCKGTVDSSTKKEFTGKPLSSNNIPNPAKTLLIVDSSYTIISWWHVTDSPPVILGNKIIEDTAYVPGLKINKDRKLWSGQQQDAINGRHPNKTVNVGFVDGHISCIKADDLLIEKINNSYNNQIPLWIPK